MITKKIFYGEKTLRAGLRISFSLSDALVLLLEIIQDIVNEKAAFQENIKKFRSKEYLFLKKSLVAFSAAENVWERSNKKVLYWPLAFFRQLEILTPRQAESLKPLVLKVLNEIIIQSDLLAEKQTALKLTMFQELVESISFKNKNEAELFFDQLERVLAYLEVLIEN